ncbi:MAG TPA: hypothetical protein VMF30_00520 [Pirellulales bacterium]|nr:hypothetical protein [Pirellulales bacterium]
MFVARILIASALIAAATAVSTPAEAATNMDRATIRSMPITTRPSRPGHFYGNTVRRINQRRGG